MLIILGMLLQIPAWYFDFNKDKLFPVLEVLGIIGLIMIVLEAALDMKLSRENLPLIIRSTIVALLGVLGTTFVCAFVFRYFFFLSNMESFIYAVPLSIMSSAIVIPSVDNLSHKKKEFMIYESTIADILGIMFFYLLIANAEETSTKAVAFDVIANVTWTILLSIIISYALVVVFQKLKTEVKLFLLIAVLLLLYAIGKLFHLSSLLIILVFGLVLHNNRLFFRGYLKKWLDKDSIGVILDDFKLITAESAFIVRTFFFVIFGVTLSFASIFSIKVFLISCIVIAIIFLIRYVLLAIFVRRDIKPQLYIAPRGLVTILLFFAIPEQYMVEDFGSGVILFTIIATSIFMTISLIKSKEKENLEEEDINDLLVDEEGVDN
jgi:NhaP-type Na+/H+ or K+/H+ antiporter